jgi:succinyl-diaminopimelate desuccinylase
LKKDRFFWKNRFCRFLNLCNLRNLRLPLSQHMACVQARSAYNARGPLFTSTLTKTKTMTEHLESADLRPFIRSHATDLRQYLVDLIRARTVNPPGDEFRAAEVLTAFCRQYDIPYETYEKEPGRTNIVARIGRGRPRIMVPCHFDTVPAGDGWQTDPFEPVEIDGCLYGRGAKDDKGPLAAMMLVARYLKEREAALPGQLILVGAADEEAGRRLGMMYLLEECGLEAEAAIVPDSGYGMKLIDVGEKGVLFMRATAAGRQAHGSEPSRGASAVWPMIDFLSRIREWRPPGGATELFTAPTFNLGAVHGGTVPNMVPARCEALLDIRYLPGGDGDAIVAHLVSVLKDVESQSPGVRMELEVLSPQLPSLVPIDHPLVGEIERRTMEVTGARPSPAGQSGATVAKFLILRGIPAVGFTCGPESGEHMAGEYMGLDELARFAEVMTLVITDLMSGERT